MVSDQGHQEMASCLREAYLTAQGDCHVPIQPLTYGVVLWVLALRERLDRNARGVCPKTTRDRSQ